MIEKMACLMILLTGCVTEFVPEVSEEKELLVVEGLISDQPVTNTVRLSKSLPLGKKSEARPLSGYVVRIIDDLGNDYSLKDIGDGKYITDSTVFKGIIGRIYTLKISTNTGDNNLTYESSPVQMQPVPPIDSLYYEKTVIRERTETIDGIDGCQIYLSTNDPNNMCKFYRWNFVETWMIRLNFSIPNKVCWLTEKSDAINIKSTVNYSGSVIDKFPVTFISNVTDRLKNEYSILVDQYSMNEDEYTYWEKLKNITEESGGLYDIIPFSIPGNLRCNEHPDESVLGYFSVSAKSSKRIFIKDNFAGIIDPYANCVTEVTSNIPPGLNSIVWILLANVCSTPCVTTYAITTDVDCTDCTLRGGTTKKPDFWKEE